MSSTNNRTPETDAAMDRSSPTEDHEQASADRRRERSARAGCLWKLPGYIGLAIGFACFLAFVSAGQIVPALVEEGLIPDSVAGRLIGVVLSIAVAIGLGSLVVAGSTAYLKRGRQKEADKADDLLLRDTRRPVLYLRSFTDDRVAARSAASISNPFTLATEEEQLARVMGEIGPFIAIGEPGEPLPDLGAARMYVGNDEWQEAVLSLIARAQLVVLRAGDTPGFWWEVEAAVQRVQPERLLFLIPYDREGYEAFRRKAQAYLPRPLPEYVGRKTPRILRKYLLLTKYTRLNGILYFEPDWTPHFRKFTPALGRMSFKNPLLAGLKVTLRPVFEQLRTRWNPPPIPWVQHTLLGIPLLFCLLFLGGEYWAQNQLPPEYEAQSRLESGAERREPESAGSDVEKRIARDVEALTSIPEFKAAFAGLSRERPMRVAGSWRAKGFFG